MKLYQKYVDTVNCNENTIEGIQQEISLKLAKLNAGMNIVKEEDTAAYADFLRGLLEIEEQGCDVANTCDDIAAIESHKWDGDLTEVCECDSGVAI